MYQRTTRTRDKQKNTPQGISSCMTKIREGYCTMQKTSSFKSNMKLEVKRKAGGPGSRASNQKWRDQFNLPGPFSREFAGRRVLTTSTIFPDASKWVLHSVKLRKDGVTAKTLPDRPRIPQSPTLAALQPEALRLDQTVVRPKTTQQDRPSMCDFQSRFGS